MKEMIRKNFFRLATLGILVAAMLLTPFIGSGYSKYKQENISTNEVSYSNQLAEDFCLLQHGTRQNSDGSYTAETETSLAESLYMIPGTELPLEPWLEISGKTEVKAVLFAVIGSDADYTLTEDWTDLNLTAEDGRVYVYKAGAVLDQEIGERFEAKLLAEPISLGPVPVAADKAFDAVGYLIQTGEQYEATPEQAAALFSSRILGNAGDADPVEP